MIETAIMEWKKNKKTIVWLIVLLVNTSAYAQVNINEIETTRIASDGSIVWQQVSPGNGGMSNTLRYHPTIPGHITFMGDMWCAYQSVDNGKKWSSITDHDGKGEFSRQRDLVYSTSDPNFGISICSSLMFKSEDTGKSWQPVTDCPWYQKRDDGLDRSSWLSKVGGLGLDPSNKDIWFVGGGKFVRGDVSFSCYLNPTQAQPFGPPVINQGKLWRTKDGGTTWDQVGGDFDSLAQTGPIKIHPTNSQLVFAATTHGVYRSTNGGDNWTNVTEGQVDNNIIMDLDYYYNAETNKFILYVIDQVQFNADGNTTNCTGGIFQSVDNGNTWQNINGNLYLDFNKLTGGVSNFYYRYIAKWFGISENDARLNYPNLPTKALQPMDQLTTDPTREGALYVGLPSTHTNNSIVPGRLWTTDDGGVNWTNTARLYSDVWGNDAEYWESRGNPWEQNLEIGVESAHVQWGDNYALRGTRGLDVGIDGSVMMLSEHTTSLSKDYGKTWRQVDSDFTPSGAFLGRGNSDLPAHVVAQDKRQKQTYLGSGEHRLWITTDDSPDERQGILNILNSVETISTIAFDPYDADVVYVTSSRQHGKQHIFRSDDGGYNWVEHGIATPGTDKWGDDFYTNALTIDPINTQYMYHGITQINFRERSTEGGFFRSVDGGKSFTQSNTGLPNPARIKDIQFDPRDDTRASLFAAAEKYSFNYRRPLTEGGLYHSSDRGLTWEKVNTPPSVEGVQHIRFDHMNRMYITTGYRGGGDGVWYTDDFGENWTHLFTYPRVENIDISPFDHNIIVITLRYLSNNPGVYISRDRGLTWSKSNENIVVPQHVETIKMDLHNAGQVWIGTLGTGFYKGQIKDGDKIQKVKLSEAYFDLELSNTHQLEAKIVQPGLVDETISWKSANPSVATVDQNGMVTPVGLGNTKIWATAANGRFADYSTVVVKEAVITSIAPTPTPEIQIIPNPASDHITITGLSSIEEVYVMDLNGAVVLQTVQTSTINISKLQNGIYILIVVSDEGHFYEKIIKQ